MKPESILLIGAGGHARACIDVIEQEGRFSVVGLIGLIHEVGSKILGYPVLGTDVDLSILLGEYKNALVTVGQIKSSKLRISLYETLKMHNCILPSIVSPTAYVSKHAVLGEGTIVMHGAIINACATVGHNCIINSQSLVEHDVTISDHCHISTAAVINSGVNIGKATFIGSNSSIRQCINIGEHCLIGMGQRVLSDCVTGTQIPNLKS
jgi:sugar O-acyltransferase (sialic acid O-acetyltransferase NeuD family)